MRQFVLILTILHLFNYSHSQAWKNVSPKEHTLISSGSFIDKEEGWLFTQSAYTNTYILLHTKDGAQSFDSIYSTPNNRVCWNLQMIDSLNGFAKIESLNGSGDYFWKTIDGGHSWIDITDDSLFGGPLCGFNGFYFIDKLTGVFGGNKCIYKTIDGGITWSQMNTPIFIDSTSSNNYGINSIYFLNNKFGWATCSMVMDVGFGLKTIDGGENWTVCTPLTANLYGVHFHDSLNGGMVGSISIGSSFYSSVLGTNDNFNSISYQYSISSIPPWDQLPYAISYQNDSTIWISGFPAVLKRSINKGLTFINYDSAFATNTFNDCIFDMPFFGNTGYAIAYSFLLKFVDTLNTLSPDLIPSNGLIQLSPNPVFGKCKLNISSIKVTSSCIKIYSVNGDFLLKYDKILAKGENEIFLNLESLPPGFYILVVDNYSGKVYKKFIKN